MATRIQLRRDTAANWTSINPILASGEPGYETNSIKYKIGDGVTDWNSLPYFSRAHDELTNLDYASAGHTGFASTDALTSTSGALQTNIDANTALITTISGQLDDHDEMNNLDYASAGHTGFQPAGDYAINTDLATVSGLTDTNASAISDNTTLIATTSGSLQNEIDSKSSTLLELTDTPVAYDNEKYLISTASGTEWATVSSGIELAGADTEIQFNDGGVLGADSNFTWDKATQRLAIIGDIQTGAGHWENVFLGIDAVGAGNLTGTYNVGIGAHALHNAEDSNNVGVGYRVLQAVTTGQKNVAVGTRAGQSNVTGWYNVFLGDRAGYNETGHSKLYIASSDTATPLIYGEFNTPMVRVNGDFDITGDLTVDGTAPFATTENLATTSGTLQTQIDSQAEKSWVTVTGTHTVTTGGQNIFTDTTGGAFTITMYDNPEEGQRSTFMDKGGYSTTNNVTISGGSEKLHGENQYLYLNENYGSFTLVYGDANSGWMATASPSFMTLDQA